MSQPMNKPPRRTLSLRVAVSPETLERFRKFYPDYGDVSNVLHKLLRNHLEALETQGQSESVLPLGIGDG